MINLAGIVPHPLILIPNIGKENQKLLNTTANSFLKIAEELKNKKIDTLIIISSHGPIGNDIFSINLSEKFEINFEEFGDFASKAEVDCDLELTQTIRENMLRFNNTQMINSPVLDYGTGIPLYLISPELKDLKIVSINISNANLKKHFDFGKKIAEKIKTAEKNIAVFASADLSHCLNKKAPAKYCAKGAKLDKRLIEQLKEKDVKKSLETCEELMEKPMACGPRAIAVLLGILDKEEYETNILSYEAPFGIGNLTALFDLS